MEKNNFDRKLNTVIYVRDTLAKAGIHVLDVKEKGTHTVPTPMGVAKDRRISADLVEAGNYIEVKVTVLLPYPPKE